ncbi:Cullin-domain-containing protein [Aaosphaeria arxii CBS 175.79]|uniref:Cullin-domain-containing protein n=1 Tax=Aaosphaeria arxii CBS 175.79 TaxID=1450172 RepID=A0A6A5XEN9_9PLEO|nr:Cullin-domain-containing protein [Aaosphaeria arxii CBS 175.79]KAF2011380.1 Cullin-domain-containing protein [Aaosphaeria arxii CBS 175.79]
MSPTLKRKHSDKTITELFTTQHPKPNSTAALSPTSKRSRIGSSEAPSESAAMSTANMYHFPSRSGKEVIDIASSPDTSPKAPQQKNGLRKATPNIAGGTAPKRMLVKNFKPARKIDPKAFLNQTWEKVDKALDTVFAQGKIDFSLEELYRGVENLCRQGLAKDTCDRLDAKCKRYITDTLKEKVKETLGRKDVDVLRATLQAWATWMDQMKYVAWVFCYLDRSYLLPKQDSLHDISVGLFRSIIFEHEKLKPHIVDGACDLIATDRDGKDLDRGTFGEAIKMFHDMHVYTKHFEPRMLELSQNFIHEWAERESSEKGLAEYVKASRALIKSELARVEHFSLDRSTRRDLVTLLEDHLISRKESRLTNQDEFADLLELNAVEDLKSLYDLLERRNLGSNLKEALSKWIEDTGTAIVFNEKEQDTMVINLLTLKRQLDTIWKTSFHRNAELGHGLRESFETFMNKTKKTSTTWNTDNSKPGEMIAKYVDMLLRGGAKAIPAQLSRKAEKPAAADGAAADVEEDNEDVMFDEDTEVNNQLDQVLDLFRFVHGKAVFEAFYKKDLARRLLMGRSASADAERSMLARLKTECGAGFTANLEQMFKDIELSREEMTSYKTLLASRDTTPNPQPFDLTVSILSASAWPTYPQIPVLIPPSISTTLSAFETHYASKHSGRKLTWHHSLAHCQLRARFPRGNKELIVSSFQAIVLLLFNTSDPTTRIPYTTIAESTSLPPAELNRTLQSLACAKLRPLTKHPKGREIAPTDVFTLNASFTDPKYRVKINTVQLKETPQENKETHERVAQDRNYETQAAIVRIMKARRRIGHAELVAETIKVTRSRGTLDVGGIKRNIDRLIEKEFLERDEEGGGGYCYVA